MTFEDCFKQVLAAEGGWKFTDDPNDPGGMTYGGMTYKTFYEWAKKHVGSSPSPEGFKAWASDPKLSVRLQSEIRDCYKDTFWNPLALDTVQWRLWPKLAIYSCAVNMSVKDAAEIVQIMCGVAVDGILGKVSNAKIEEKNRGPDSISELEKEFKRLWRMRYVTLVLDNLKAWEAYTDKLVVFARELPPKTKRWKYLAGWLNRVDHV